MNDIVIEENMIDQTVDGPVEIDKLPRPWGFWVTIGFSAIMAMVYFGISFVIAIVFIIGAKIVDSQADINQIGQTLSESGLMLGVSTIITTPVVIGMCVLFAFCRKPIRVRDYLDLRWAGGRQVLVWLAALGVFILASDLLTVSLGRPVVPESMVTVYQTSVFPPLLFIAIIVCAPLGEEFFFRGFLFKGLWRSWPGPIGATIITSLIWALIHVQYDWYGIVSIFAGGLLLGAARIRTNSIVTPIIMHMAMNFFASGELLISQVF